MFHLILSLVLALGPSPRGLDLPPEGIYETAQATEVAVRVDTPTTTAEPVSDRYAPPGLSNCDEMSWYRVNVGLPARFDSIGWRESNCRNEEGVRTFCCYGYWQLNIGLFLRDHRMAPRLAECGVDSYQDVNSDTPEDKRRQACAAKALYTLEGFAPWST